MGNLAGQITTLSVVGNNSSSVEKTIALIIKPPSTGWQCKYLPLAYFIPILSNFHRKPMCQSHRYRIGGV